MAEEVWMLQTKKADFKQIGARFRIDPVTARIIRNRGIEGEAAIDRYLNGTLDDLYDPMLLKDMERAVSILCEAVDTGKKIRIVGDYDIDGVCSTYILLQAFERLGSDVDFEIPDRIKDGYGINESIIEQAHADGVEVILTCDNGISAFHQVELAKKYGMTVVITDHHEVPLDGEKEKIPTGGCGDRSETGRLSVPISGDLRRSGGVQAGAGFICPPGRAADGMAGFA